MKNFLVHLLQVEAEQRKENQRKRRIKAAKFPMTRTLDTFDFNNLKHVAQETVWDLATNNYIERYENIICMVHPGMGKSHLSIALGLLGCNGGFKVRFYSAPMLASELVEAQESHRWLSFKSSSQSLIFSSLTTFHISAFLSNNPNCYFK